MGQCGARAKQGLFESVVTCCFVPGTQQQQQQQQCVYMKPTECRYVPLVMGQVNPVLGRCYINLTLGEFLTSCLLARKCDDKSPIRRALTELLSSIFFKFITKIFF